MQVSQADKVLILKTFEGASHYFPVFFVLNVELLVTR